MHFYYILSSLIAACYLAYYILVKFISKAFSAREIVLFVYILIFFVSVFIFRDEFKGIYGKLQDNNKLALNAKYIVALVALACVMVLNSWTCIYAANTKINFGKIDSLAHAIYLPTVAFISAYFFKHAIGVSEYFGISLIAIGAWLIHIG